ncbi:phospholipase A2 inhibitor gamma subunit B-like [Rhineura floridana]|uniref:phospholipase A2 inhibitor gamma subunit B-like n=1 Tax=Rhineura floridana TaxID=261503 RepID=UPI002AC81271|nr:phospholipase A2 inhibitor gamma subunit B-like [Rhineura floridana]
MQMSLIFYLFFLLLATADSLECEACIDLNNSCNGTMVTCGANEDTCAVSFSESIVVEVAGQITVKGCASSHVCSGEPFYLNFGQTFITRGSVVCCKGAACASASPELPPVNNITNGMKCPACVSLLGPCSTDVAECTGAENYCIDIVYQTGGPEITIKGCTTKTYCAALQQNIAITLNVPPSAIIKTKCEPANKAPLSSRFPLLALSGLLMVIILL